MLWLLSPISSLLVLASLPVGRADLLPFEHSDEFNDGEYGPWVLQGYHTTHLTSPRVNMMKPFSACEDGSKIFIAPRGEKIDPMPLILDSNGSLIWTADQQYGEIYNFRSQMYRGERYLTFWAGVDTIGGHGAGKYYMLDRHYEEYAQVDATGGLRADLHEFLITDDDTALITIYEPVAKDLSSLPGGLRDGVVWESMFQELDLETREALFTWRASEHVDLGESYEVDRLLNGTGFRNSPWDWLHINSVAKDPEGNYLVSARYSRSIFCVSGQTGKVLWTLGGKNNSFADLSSGQATTFAGQHDARWADWDRSVLTLFDNRADADHNFDDKSTGTRVVVDSVAMTARLDHVYEHVPNAILSTSQGSYQTLPNGNVFLGYGYNGVMSEFSAEGELLCDAFFEPSSMFDTGNVQSYRNYKLPWVGFPNTQPTLVLKDEVFYVSWLGATEVTSWVVRHSNISDADGTGTFQDLFQFERDGFETGFALRVADRVRRYIHAVAVDASGGELATSRTICVSGHKEFWAKYALLEPGSDIPSTDDVCGEQSQGNSAMNSNKSGAGDEDPRPRIASGFALTLCAITILVICASYFGWRNKFSSGTWVGFVMEIQATKSRYITEDEKFPWWSRLATIEPLSGKSTHSSDDWESSEYLGLYGAEDLDVSDDGVEMDQAFTL